MFEDFFKIEKRWGESRAAQVLGVVMLILVFAGSIIYMIFR